MCCRDLLDIGFDDVFEVARAAEIVTEYTRRYMKRKDINYPVINSACPVVVRLITLRFPYLCDHVIPMMPPIEVAGRMAREEALQKTSGTQTGRYCNGVRFSLPREGELC